MSLKWPTMSPGELIPKVKVLVAPGKSICVKVPSLLNRKPWKPAVRTPTMSPRELMRLAKVLTAPGKSIYVKVPSLLSRKP